MAGNAANSWETARWCGRDLEGSAWPVKGLPVAVSDNDRSFSVGWMLGGMVWMFASHLFGSSLAVSTGVTSVWWMAAIGGATFAVPGFVIGWKSDGEPRYEAGLAAVIAIAFAAGARGLAVLAIDEPGALVVSLAAPFAIAVAAAWLGERLQHRATAGDGG